MKEELQAARQSFEQDTNLQQIIIPMKQTSRKFFGLFGPKQEYDTYIQLDKNNSGRIEATHYNPKGFFARLFESNNVKQAILDVFPGSKFSKAHANKDAISNKIIPKIEEEFYDAQTTLQTDPDTVSRAASISATSNHSVKPIQPYDAKSIASNVSERTVVPADVRSIVSDSTIVAPENFMDARDTIPEQTPAPKRLARSVSELSLRAEVPEEKQVPA